MNRCAYQHQQHQKAALVGLGCVGEIRRGDSFINSSSMAVYHSSVVCPKPRRLVNVNVNGPINIRPSRVVHATTTSNYQMEASESRAGTELLDLILTKGNNGAEKLNFQVASSPPFFNGSPPVRASNPVIQDEQFRIGKIMSPLSPSMEALAKNGSGGSSGRVKCVNKPAPVRIEGFECRGTAVVA